MAEKTMVTPTKCDDVQSLLNMFSKELSEESTVVDLDAAAALARESSARSSISKATDIDELASQSLSHLSDCEKREAWLKSFNQKREKLERVERVLLKGYHEDNVGNCLFPTVDDSHEVLMADWNIKMSL